MYVFFAVTHFPNHHPFPDSC